MGEGEKYNFYVPTMVNNYIYQAQTTTLQNKTKW